MRKLTIAMSMLLTLGLFCACSKEDEVGLNFGKDDDLIRSPEEGETLNPVNLFELKNREKDNNVLASFYFFNEQLPIGKRSESFFMNSDKDECYVINNLQELKNIYHGEASLPEINFKRYTLVIGQQVTSKVTYPMIKQFLEFHNDQCQLKLYVPNYDGEIETTQYIYHWALYPKFKSDGISVGFVKDGSAIRSLEEATGQLGYDKKGYGWYISYSKPNTFDSVDFYYLLNLPNEVEVNTEEVVRVNFSGYIVEMTDDSREALGKMLLGGYSYYFIYLTNIEKGEAEKIEIPYRGNPPFTVTDMPGMMLQNSTTGEWSIAYIKDDTFYNSYYPTELSEEFKVIGLNVVISGNVYEEFTKPEQGYWFKNYKIKLTKIEKAE